MKNSKLKWIILAVILISISLLFCFCFLFTNYFSNVIVENDEIQTEINGKSINLIKEFCSRLNEGDYIYIFNDLFDDEVKKDVKLDEFNSNMLYMSEYFEDCYGFLKVSSQRREYSIEKDSSFQIYKLAGEIKFYSGHSPLDVNLIVTYNTRNKEVKIYEIEFFID